jgi:hypothetical protein
MFSEVKVLARSILSRSEDARTDTHHGTALLDGDGVIIAHAHRKGVEGGAEGARLVE